MSHSLLLAVKDGSLSRMQECIRAGADTNCHNGEGGWTPLCHAAARGDIAAVAFLVEHGADPLLTGDDNRTPYAIAISACHREVAQYLRDLEERGDSDRAMTSSRGWETRPYCRAYYLRDLRAYQGWNEDSSHADGDRDAQLPDETTVFVHSDFSVTTTVRAGDGVVFGKVTEEWKSFCSTTLGFAPPTDFDLIPEQQRMAIQERQ